MIVLRRRVYGASYYGHGRDPSSRGGLSGYEQYTRATSNADVAAYLLWRFFPPGRVLDAGCAHGFVVEALREVGVDAKGVDASRFAITHAPRNVSPYLRRADLTKRLPFPRESFDVVTVLETLEHVPVALVPRALENLRRVCRGWVVATIPSFGPNAGGPPGWLDGKVREERIADLYALGPDFDGPVAEDDLARDAQGRLVEGHVTIASVPVVDTAVRSGRFCAVPSHRAAPASPHRAVRPHHGVVLVRVPSALDATSTDRRA